MFRSLRLRNAHNKFLESCRNLKEGRAYWDKASYFSRLFFETLIPIPLIGLHEDGRLLLEALQWLEIHCRQRPVDEETIKHYHRVITPSHQDAGQYRKEQITILGSKIERPRPERVAPLIKQCILKLSQDEAELSGIPDQEKQPAVLEIAAGLHQRIALIHPFRDGNGRVARLAMNHVLRRHGFEYVILPPMSESREHFDTLEEAHRGNMVPFLAFAKANLHRV